MGTLKSASSISSSSSASLMKLSFCMPNTTVLMAAKTSRLKTYLSPKGFTTRIPWKGKKAEVKTYSLDKTFMPSSSIWRQVVNQIGKPSCGGLRWESSSSIWRQVVSKPSCGGLRWGSSSGRVAFGIASIDRRERQWIEVSIV